MTEHVLWLPSRGGGAAWREAHATSRPREADGVLYLFTLFGLWLLNAADLAVTLVWVDRTGWGAEANVWMRKIAEVAGPFGFVVYKLTLMTGIVLLLWYYFLYSDARLRAARSRQDLRNARLAYRLLTAGAGALCGFYVWVLVNNLQVAGLL